MTHLKTLGQVSKHTRNVRNGPIYSRRAGGVSAMHNYPYIDEYCFRSCLTSQE